jgi:CTD small phosphatase-like protein 2
MISGELYRTDDAINNLKNLMLFIHQNYIEILYLLYSKVRLPATIMFKKLQDIISSRRMNNVTQKAISLNQSTEILSGLLKEICKHFRKNSKQTALSTSIFSILKTANKLTYIIVKDALSQAISLSEPIMIKPNEPFLPHSPSGTYTLVLDLDETLVHFVQSEEEGTVFIRPGCEDFIKAVSEWYEVVIFTAGLQDVIFN